MNAPMGPAGRGVVLAVLVSVALTAPALRAGDAVEPGEIRTKPTWSCMGIDWPFAGDDNRNAKVTVAFRRKGTVPWREALDLWLYDFEGATILSGSVFRLAAGEAYEFRLTLTDPDGGGTVRTVAASTLAYPQMPARAVRVPTGGLVKAQQLAAPGTVMLLGAGTYPGALLSKSGKCGRWIVYRPAGDGEVVIDGRVEVRADYVWLNGLTIRHPQNAVQGSHKGVCITNCRIRSHYAIHTGRGGENYFIADNVLIGDRQGRFSFGGEGVDFGGDKGECGHAVCFNEITDFADGVSYGRGDTDVYSNYIHETVDDFIEPDYARRNYRLWNNRCYNSMCGFSFQPMKGGPWYIFDNVNVGAYLHALKVKRITGATVLCGNTMLTKSSRLGQGADLLRGWIVNNVWLRATTGPLAESGRFRPGANPTWVDYNAYGTGGAPLFHRFDYDALAGAKGWDAHSLRVSLPGLFVKPIKVPAGKPYYSSRLQGVKLPDDWRFDHNLLIPRADSKLIDAGKALPNITGPYLGKAPDLGAHEAGLGTAWYGPRTWDDESHLVYGVPTGWKKVPLARAKEFAPLGCPPAAGAKVLLAGDSPKVFALMRFEPMAGEARWRALEQAVSAAPGAETGVLRFQDGLAVRLYRVGDSAHLLAARVEPDGVLHVTVGCRWKDLPAARVRMFQFVRSLCR